MARPSDADPSAFVCFEAIVEPMPWGKSVYTVLRLSDAIFDKLGRPKRVEGEINEHPVNLAPSSAPVIDGMFLWAGDSLLKRAGITPGEPVEVRLRAVDPSIVDVPPDVARALRSSGVIGAWETLTPGKRRSMLHSVETAKRAETRMRRIAALVKTVGEHDPG
ncbi:YdeI/OmpD-associated family protein [Cognatishimia sp. F0-27]|uniref:YdeI/OmpD-associated family protein n=1 Tax=Cognatishimia sp. F0-27 TaxID=2816855 RepID=UPI001D0C955E|nr:YdeI/OmpD-associated family protein [Cognatishimia sp. F0-27]MCC1491024.1 YdeI/OmpD-associated family protein [Cognatishimia sp. F0-27]